MAYNILSLDGGGIQGVISSGILRRLSEQFPDLIPNVDLIAGTSIGGIMALAIASGVPVQDISKIYVQHGRKIFSDRGWWDRVSLDEAIRANYGPEGLSEVADHYFGDKKIKDLSKNVLITSVDLDAIKHGRRMSKPKFFESSDPKDGELLAKDVAMRTSAAPTFFPSYQGFIDGSIVANNPSDCAIVYALDKGIKLEDINLLSIGTGFKGNFIEDEHGSGGRIESLDWGYTQWATRIIQLFIHGSVMTSHYKSMKLLDDRYVRIDPDVPESMMLDSIDMIFDMQVIADNTKIEETVDWLRENWSNDRI